MTIYRKYAPTEIETMGNNLKQQLSDGILPEDMLERFKFRGPEGNTWTVLPQTGAWYCYKSGNWLPAKAPDTPMDGTTDLLDTVTLPISPLNTDKPEENEPTQKDSDIRQMLERATERVRDSYNQGKINSDGAENLLKDLYLLDPAGLIWSYGMHTEEWYFFRQDVWEISVDDGPDPLNFQAKQSDSPYSQAAKEVVERFTESGVAYLPEQIVPDWKPAPSFPGKFATGASAPSVAEIASQQPQWNLRVSQGASTGQHFTLGSHTRLGRMSANEIVLADKQSSSLHALIQRQENNYIITDQNSTNGTFVNGIRIQSPTRLHPGDTVSVGATNFFVEGEVVVPDTIGKDHSPPMKQNRMIILLAIILFVVACLCCLALGLGGFFYL